MLIIGFILSYYNILLPWTIETALIASFFVYTGYLYKKKNKESKTYKTMLLESIISIIIIVVCYKYNGSIAMLNHQYNNPILFMLGAYAGIILILTVSSLINKLISSKIILNTLYFLGKNSIIIMACHEPLKRIIIKIYSILIKSNVDVVRKSIIHSIFITGIIICTIIPIIYIINHYLPFIIGKTKKSIAMKS